MNSPNTSALNRKQGKILKAVIGLAFIIILYAAAQLGITIGGDLKDLYAPVEPGYYRVLSVADGDTFDVSMDGVKETIRLVGVDTPETHHPSKPVQCYGPEASTFVKDLIEGKQVRLAADTKQPNRDKYGRLLRYAFLPDGRELNILLVNEGYALATNFNTEKKVELKRLQTTARSKKKGLWASCGVTEQNGILRTNPA